jgi:hypothetical protein
MHFGRPTLASSLFAGSREDTCMLIEGGYLHSMKRLMEKAEQERIAYSPRPPRRPSIVRRSLHRLARLLRMKRAN